MEIKVITGKNMAVTVYVDTASVINYENKLNERATLAYDDKEARKQISEDLQVMERAVGQLVFAELRKQRQSNLRRWRVEHELNVPAFAD